MVADSEERARRALIAAVDHASSEPQTDVAVIAVNHFGEELRASSIRSVRR
jgi:hypothetical protein